MTAHRFAPALSAYLVLASPATAEPVESLSCLMEVGRSVTLSSPVGGIVAEVKVERGDEVPDGAVAARLDTALEEIRLDVARFQAASDARVRLREAELRNARALLERAKTLRDRGVGTARDYDEALARAEVAAAQVEEAAADRDLAGLSAREREAELERRILRSPIAGVATEVAVEAGEFVAPGDEVLTVASLDPLRIEAYLPSDLYAAVAEGDVATVTPFLAGLDPVDVRIDRKDLTLDLASGAFRVTADLPNPGAVYPAGVQCVLTVERPPVR